MTRRVVLYGPPLAGKATILRSFASTRGLKVDRFGAGSGAFPAVGLRTCTTSNTVIETVWGSTPNRDSWTALVEQATGFVLVLDAQGVRESLDRQFATALAAAALQRPTCVIWTKQDLVGAQASGMSDGGDFDVAVPSSWPVFFGRKGDEASLVQPIEWVLAQLG